MLLEEGHHSAGMVQEGVDALGVITRPQRVPQIGAGLLRVFMDAGAPGQRVAGHPQPAARPGGGPAEDRVLLDQQLLKN